jgi:ATP-dependent helicase/nuclease subunit B
MVDSLTLTVKDRLARWLLFRHDRQKAQSGLEIWEKPAIYLMDDWLNQAWLQSWPDQYILTKLQSKHLWQKIIHEDAATPHLNLLHVQGAAAHAFKAYQLIRQYRLPEHPSGFDMYTEETRAFRRWMTRYRKQLQEWQALDPSELLDAVCQRMEQGHIPFPGEIIFYGFDEITPQMQSWLNLLKNKKVPIHFKPFEPAPVASDQLKDAISRKQASVHKYEDANEEVTQCARWIRSVYKEGKTIGIVVPEMRFYREILEREFKAELAPESVYPWVDKHIPFNISMGTPLSHEPIVHLALLLLAQKNKRIPLITFSTLITSPFINNPSDEAQARRELDWKMRGRNITHVFLPKALSPEYKAQCASLSALLDEWMKWMDDSSSRLPSEWAGKITKLLKNVGWALEQKETDDSEAAKQKISSRQFQALNSWRECLDSLSSLDRILQKITRHQAVTHLTHIVGETKFQPQTRDEPIQVVDLPESAGMEFDHLWIMGCHAEALPPFPDPNPFLPFLSHQRPYPLPHSTADRELSFTEQTLFRLAHTCDRMMFSYPVWQGEKEMSASPLLAPWLAEPHTIHRSTSSKVQDHPDFSIPLEKVKDYLPIPVSPKEKELIEGGYSLLKNQAECPFRAFAVHRLNSRKKDFPELDMDDSARGTLIHKVMETFWEEIKTQKALKELEQSEKLVSRIEQCVEKELRGTRIDLSQQKIFYQMEKKRLTSLILDWMKIDLKRDDFTVTHTEQEETVSLNDLTLTLKVDRIDQTDKNETILIDYKTGAVDVKKWFTERIEDPQLPLYSLKISADAIAFAHIRQGDPRYLGVSREKNLISALESNISKKRPDLEHWEELKTFWKESLHHLAAEFLEGRLRVDPLNAPDTCRYCDQVTLCRKTELLNRQNGEDE